MFLTGWGRTENKGNPSSTLQKIDLEVITPGVCKRSWPKLDKAPSQICTNGGIGRDSCQVSCFNPPSNQVDIKATNVLVWSE